MRGIKYLSILISVSAFINVAVAQCTDFARKQGLAKLDTAQFIHDGYLNSVMLSEGENIDLYKPFFKGRTYRVIVLTPSKLPEVSLKAVNSERQIVVSKDSKNHLIVWEYTPDSNQNLVLTVKVQNGNTAQKSSDCVAILVGYKK